MQRQIVQNLPKFKNALTVEKKATEKMSVRHLLKLLNASTATKRVILHPIVKSHKDLESARIVSN